MALSDWTINPDLTDKQRRAAEEHIKELEASGFEDRLQDIDAKLAAGWKPEGVSADVLVGWLRQLNARTKRTT